MNEQRGGGKADCYYHLNEVFVGVCPLCLYERLLVLSAKQAADGTHTSKGTMANLRRTTINDQPPPIVVLPKIFTLTSLFNRFESSRHRRKSQNSDDCSSTLSQDDSFISIKFENNGAGSWEKNKVSKVSLDQCNKPWKNNNNNQIFNNKVGGAAKTEIGEQAKKPRGRTSLRWRKRIGHLFHVMSWKKSERGYACHVGSKKKKEGVKVRKGCIRTLTKRREPRNKGAL